MSLADIINGAFEVAGSIFVLNHCLVLKRDRMVRGVSALSIAVFGLWGVWNLYYYPILGQWFSAGASVLVVAANAAYFVLILRFRRDEQAGVMHLHEGEVRLGKTGRLEAYERQFLNRTQPDKRSDRHGR